MPARKFWFGSVSAANLHPGGQVSIRAAVSTNVRVTPASQMMLQQPIHASRPALDAGLMKLGQEDQRIYRALHTPHRIPITPLNNYPHRPRRTHNALSQRVPLA